MFNFFKRNKASQEPSNQNEGEKKNIEMIHGYTYQYLDEVPEEERIPCNEFCKHMMSENKVYKRTDIEKMSAVLGYSVWDRRGGWIDKGDKDENGDPIEHQYIKDGVEYYHCKHQWVSGIFKKEI